MLIPSTRLTHRRPGTIYHVVEPDPQWIRPAEYFGSPLRRCDFPHAPGPDTDGPEILRYHACRAHEANLAPESMDVVRLYNAPMGDESLEGRLPEALLETALRILAPGGRLYIGASITPLSSVSEDAVHVAQRMGATVRDGFKGRVGGQQAIELWRALSQALGFRFRTLIPATELIREREERRVPLTERDRGLRQLIGGSPDTVEERITGIEWRAPHRTRWLMAVNFGFTSYRLASRGSHLVRLQKPRGPLPEAVSGA